MSDPTAARVTYAELFKEIEGLPPDSASVTWVKGLNPKSPISEENAILISAQIRLDHRREALRIPHQAKPVSG